MNNENKLEGVPTLYYEVSIKFLRQLEKYYKEYGYTAILIEKTDEIPLDTLALNYGTIDSPFNVTFTFVPIPDENYSDNSILLQIYTVLSIKPQLEIMNELEKAVLFINNQIPVGHFGISNGNEITLRTVQSIPIKENQMSLEPIDRVIEFFEMIISIYSPYLADICSGKITFKEFAFKLSK